jgi:hypothetical protein
VHRVWLTLAWVATVVADFFIFGTWMSQSLDENCDDVGEQPCDELLLRDFGIELPLILIVFTVGVMVVVFKNWNRT